MGGNDDDGDDDVLKRMLISGWVQECQEGGLCLTITRPRRVLVSIKHAQRLFTFEWISNTKSLHIFLEVMKTATNDIFMHDQEPVIALIFFMIKFMNLMNQWKFMHV